MNWSLIISIAALVVGPTAGLLVAIIANNRTKRDNALTANVQNRTVDVEERNSETNYFTAIIDGFVEQNRIQNLALSKLEHKVESLESRINNQEAREALMRNYIETLKKMVPTPPGAPPTPF
jgi:uncharacterized membrane-anchored protein YhcB (DUF1043 family)